MMRGKILARLMDHVGRVKGGGSLRDGPLGDRMEPTPQRGDRAEFYLGDDSTMDTVIGCSGCGWEGRYNPEPSGMDDESDDGWRVRAALAMAEEDHECAALEPTSPQ